MLYLYDKRTTDFTSNGNPIHHAYDVHVKRDEGFYLEFKLLLDKDKKYRQIKKEMIISAMTPDGRNQFRVFEINPKKDHVEVIALHLFYYLDNRLVRPFKLNNADGMTAITAFKSNFVSEITPYTFDSSVSERHDFQAKTDASNDDYLNALEVIQRIGVRYDSEFMLNGFDVRMVKRLGRRTNALLHERKNISDFVEESNINSLITRIHAVSRWTIGHDEPGYVENGNNEREIKVVVDSPLIGEYAQIYEREYENNHCRTEQELINWAKLKYSTHKVDLPRRSIEVKTNIIDGTEINLGDDLVLKYTLHDVDEMIRCVGYDYDPISKEYYSITLGDWRDSFGSTISSQVVDVSERQKNQLETLKKEVQIVMMAANGINRVARGPQPVPNPIDGDMWFYHTLDRPNDIEFRIYNAELGKWIKSGFDKEAFEQKFTHVTNQVRELEQNLTESQERHTKTLEDFRKEMDEMGYQPQDFDKLKSEMEAVRETSRVNAEMIGNDGITRYNKNLLKGAFDRKIGFNDGKLTLEANDGGFKRGETYTISFEAVCELIAKVNVDFNLDQQVIRNVMITLTPTNPKFPVVETTGKAVQLYPDTYTVRLVSDWYQTQSSRWTITGERTVTIDLDYREIADGNLERTIQGIWAEEPEIILDGGGVEW